MVDRVPEYIDRILDFSGRAFAILPLLLILVQFTVVLMVYVFKSGSIQLQESLQYINAIMFLGGAGYAALKDDHVRVDIFYGKFSAKQKARVNFYGCLFLLVPFLALFWITATPYAAASWRIMEASIESSGLPLIYILKTTLLLFPLTLSLHVVACLMRSYNTLKAS